MPADSFRNTSSTDRPVAWGFRLGQIFRGLYNIFLRILKKSPAGYVPVHSTTWPRNKYPNDRSTLLGYCIFFCKLP